MSSLSHDSESAIENMNQLKTREESPQVQEDLTLWSQLLLEDQEPSLYCKVVNETLSQSKKQELLGQRTREQ